MRHMLMYDIVKVFRDRLNLNYVVANLPGLAKARNVALAADIDSDIVAWIDDDEIADSFWLSEISRSFAQRPDATAVSGLVLPAELLTMPQMWFEQYGGHSKGRGYTPTEFSPATRHIQHPLFPLPLFGSGVNMAFRISALRDIGGFDEALGAGVLTMGAEDTKMFSESLMSGATVLYRPSAVTRHFHRRDEAALERQMTGYGVGLTAYYTALLISHPQATSGPLHVWRHRESGSLHRVMATARPLSVPTFRGPTSPHIDGRCCEAPDGTFVSAGSTLANVASLRVRLPRVRPSRALLRKSESSSVPSTAESNVRRSSLGNG